MRSISFQHKSVKFTQQLNTCRCSCTLCNWMWSLTLPTVLSTTVQKKFRSSALVSQWQPDGWWPLQASVIGRLITSTTATEHLPLPFFSIVFLWRTSHREELNCTESDFLLTTSWRYNHSCSYRTEETWQTLISLFLSSECCLWIIIIPW